MRLRNYAEKEQNEDKPFSSKELRACYRQGAETFGWTRRSQVMGGIVWGIGMALEEESVIDHHFGRIMNHNFAEYHVPVNADVQDIEVIFVEEHDDIVNPLGIKGLGEIGLVGVAAAIANGVFHATGRRVRELPITLDKVL